MDTPEKLYSYFIQALKKCIADIGRGAQKKLAIDAGISEPLLSQILNDTLDKAASMKTQVNLAKACGYSYEGFLEMGRRIANGEKVDGYKKNSGTAQVQTKSGGADMSSGGADVDHYRSELSVQRKEVDYLRKEVDYLRGERDEIRMERDKLREALKALEAKAQQPEPAKEEKKTAV